MRVVLLFQFGRNFGPLLLNVVPKKNGFLALKDLFLDLDYYFYNLYSGSSWCCTLFHFSVSLFLISFLQSTEVLT